MTFFWGILDARARTFTYVNAGHNPPYLRRSDGRVQRLDRGGMILGVLKTSLPYEQGMVSVREGDILLLFTDGVSEAMDKLGREYGEERLEATLHQAAGQNAQDIMLAIQHDVHRHAVGAAQSDDITLMVVRVTSSGTSS